jgi:hypothetical protein
LDEGRDVRAALEAALMEVSLLGRVDVHVPEQLETAVSTMHRRIDAFVEPGQTNAIGRAVAAMSDDDCKAQAQDIRDWLAVVEAQDDQDLDRRDATIAGVAATAAAEGVSGAVDAGGAAIVLPRLRSSATGTVIPPRAIGDDTPADWAGRLPPGMPALVRTGAARQRAIDDLRAVAEGLRLALPEATGVEKKMMELVVFHSIDEIIDCLQLISPEQKPAIETVQRLDGAVRLLVLATKILEGIAAWSTAAEWIHKALRSLGYA